MVKRELYVIADGMYLRYGKYMAAASAALLTINNLKLASRQENLEDQLEKNLEKTWKRTWKVLE